MTASHQMTPALRRRQRTVVLSCVAVIALMGAMSYAAVPLYDLFCRVTGYGGTVQTAQASPTDIIPINRDITVRFDGNVANGLPWDFGPVDNQVSMKIGETSLINYRTRNNSDETITGMATFNVTPQQAGAYFNKIQCFCFTEHTLAPGEEDGNMAVSFYVDPAIADDPEMESLDTITLSYTFFPMKIN